jgi:hypothetical protein
MSVHVQEDHRVRVEGQPLSKRGLVSCFTNSNYSWIEPVADDSEDVLNRDVVHLVVGPRVGVDVGFVDFVVGCNLSFGITMRILGYRGRGYGSCTRYSQGSFGLSKREMTHRRYIFVWDPIFLQEVVDEQRVGRLSVVEPKFGRIDDERVVFGSSGL